MKHKLIGNPGVNVLWVVQRVAEVQPWILILGEGDP